MKKKEVFSDSIASIFDLDARGAMARKHRAMCKLIDIETGITRTSDEASIVGSFIAVGNTLRRAIVRYGEVHAK